MHLGLSAREFGLVSARHPEVTLPWATLCEYLDLCFHGLAASVNSHPVPVWEPVCGCEFSGEISSPPPQSPGQDRKFS